MQPLKDFIQRALISNSYSPDLFSIQRDYSAVPVFIYGCEKIGLSENKILEGYKRVAIGKTMTSQYTMFVKKVSETEVFPVVMATPDNQQWMASRVQGDIFLVPPRILFDLDSVFQNGMYFKRVYRYFTCCDPVKYETKDETYVRHGAHMYLGNPKMWEDLKALHDITIPEEKSKFPYYTFTRKDDAPNKGNRSYIERPAL